MKKEKSTKSDSFYEKRHNERRIKLMIILVVLVVVLTVADSVLSIQLFSESVKEEKIQTATGTVSLAASFIDTDRVDDYLKLGEDTPGYKETRKTLYNIRNNSAGIEYLYVLRIEKDGCHFIFDLDSNNKNGVEAYKPGEVVEFEEAFKPYLPDLFAGKEIAPIESNDTSGWLLTIYKPVYDKNGKCTCYVGADISLTDIREKMFSLLLSICLSSLIFLILILAIAAWISHNYRKVTEWENLVDKQEKSRQLIREIVTAFSKTVDMKDKYTNGHSFRVAKYTAMLTRELGYDEETIEKYYNIALMHDIGKIGIPEEVLNKPGKLTDEEFAIIKSHTSLGNDVLKDISIMPDLAKGACAHHERPDGKGYPNGLVGDEIPRVAQIIAVADTFDAMYSNRPYRKRMNFDKAVSIIKEASGTQLTSDVVDAFLRLVENGEFRASDDNGGGSTEDIDNIHSKYDEVKE